MTEHAVFENADIVGSGDGWVAYLESGKYSYVIYGESEDTAYIGEGDPALSKKPRLKLKQWPMNQSNESPMSPLRMP